MRQFTTSVIIDDSLLIGTFTGEMLIFSIANKNLKAIIPVSNQGLLAIALINGNLIVGSGDGKLRLLKGN